METKFTVSNYCKQTLTEYEVEACKQDAAKRAQACNECSLTEYEVNLYGEQSVTYSHIFTAAPGAPASKIERRAASDAEITAAKTNRKNKLAAMDAEIAAFGSRNSRMQNQRT